MIQVSEDHSPIGAEALDAQSEDESWLAENLASLESTAAIGDGTLVHIRPIRHDDADGLVAFHDKLSASTVYYRFFNFHPHLSKVEATRFTSVDYWDRLALVAEHDGELIAVVASTAPTSTTRRKWRSSSPTSGSTGASDRCCSRAWWLPPACAASTDSAPRRSRTTAPCWPCSSIRVMRCPCTTSGGRYR